jgi:hypothetical protein
MCEVQRPITLHGSFNGEVAFCHRCKWKANVGQLARAVGGSVARETGVHRQARNRIDLFETWLSGLHNEVAGEYRRLGKAASLAKQVLIYFPNCEPAWEALERFFSAEARLAAQLDLLSFEKVSPWLEYPIEPFALFQSWEATNEGR